MDLTKKQLAGMIDISAVKADSTLEEVTAIVRLAQEHHFFAIFTLPSLTSYAKDLLVEEQGILLGGAVGFPSGGGTTASKAFEAKELIRIGCDELDMVINIGKLKSNLYKDVATDIQRIVGIAGPIDVKVILEVSLLTEREIYDGAKIVRDSGARFIKTGTGWSGSTNYEHIHFIKNAVGDEIHLKVAGGVRDLDVLLRMRDMGVSRFGLGHQSAKKIIQEFMQRSEN